MQIILAFEVGKKGLRKIAKLADESLTDFRH
jgi:hypothetical protein